MSLLLLFVLVCSLVATSSAFVAPPMHSASRRRSALGMFTGIVEEMGKVLNLEERDDLELWDGSIGKGTQLTVEADTVLEGAYLGCSICVSGVCLTATALEPHHVIFGLAPETMRKSNLGELKQGDFVNLERASEIGGRNSGHFVQGHVDNVGTIVEKEIDGDSLFVRVVTTPELLRYIVPKGFIAVDGTSLTVVDTTENTFSFMLVEYTQKKIVVSRKPIGATVNLEVDVLAKYSETALQTILPRLQALEEKVESLEKELQQYKEK